MQIIEHSSQSCSTPEEERGIFTRSPDCWRTVSRLCSPPNANTMDVRQFSKRSLMSGMAGWRKQLEKCGFTRVVVQTGLRASSWQQKVIQAKPPQPSTGFTR